MFTQNINIDCNKSGKTRIYIVGIMVLYFTLKTSHHTDEFSFNFMILVNRNLILPKRNQL